MSRAFVKEPDGDQAEIDLPERSQSEYPNYISNEGLQKLRRDYSSLQSRLVTLEKQDRGIAAVSEIKSIESESRYLKKRIESAIPVDINRQPVADIRFGATVVLLDENNREMTVTVAGEDEVDIQKNRLSWISPLARELIGKKTGDIIIWEKPDHELELEILDFSYQSYID